MIPLLTAAAVLGLLAPQTEDTSPRLMRFPTIKGDTVVFSYGGDLWVAQVGGGLARRLTSSTAVEGRPKISNDGKWVAFTGNYEGNNDVYVIPIEGGEPKRLTFDPENENVLGWTPDGKIAYGSTAGNPFLNRQQRLWYVKPTGGLPIRTQLAEVAELSFFDSNRVAMTRVNSYGFNWRRYRGGTQGRIGFYDFAKNEYKEVPTGREQNYFPMVVGKSVYYISDKAQGTLNLWRYDTEGGKQTQVTKYTDADIRYPSSDGKSIVWERDGYLWKFDIASGEAVKLSPTLAAENLSARPYLRNLQSWVTSVDISPSGARVALEARGEIFTAPAKQGDVRNITDTSGQRERYPSWSPDGGKIAYISDATGNYELYTKPATGGEATKWTSANGTPFRGVQWTPDGKKILMGTEVNELYIFDTVAKTLKMVVKGSYGLGGYEASPDSAWIAYLDAGANGMQALKLYEVATGKTTQVSEGRFNDSDVTWDLSGKYLYLASQRTFTPGFGIYEASLKVEDATRIYVLPLAKDTPDPLVTGNDEEPVREEGVSGSPSDTPPASATPPPMPRQRPTGGEGPRPGPPSPAPVKIDFDGLADRLLPLPLPAANYSSLAGTRDGVIYRNGITLYQFNLASREPVPVLSPALGGVAFNYARTKMAVYDGRGLSVLDVRPGNPPGAGRVELTGLEMVVKPREEWKQMFWETWRWTRDHYYDSKLRGLNWKAVGDRYAAYLPYVNQRSDLSYVLGLMIGELGTGHSYVQGGDFGPMPTPIPVGNLGVDYEASGDHVRLKKIYRGESYDESRRGPLAEPGVDAREGDYLLEIDGHPVSPDVHPASLLQNKVGRYVTLTLNSTPTTTGARKVRVRPISNETQLRYADFVEANRQYVLKKSGGRIGYMHIQNTAFEGSQDFIRGYYSQTDKDAVIVDERWNGGGYIQPWFVSTLARHYQAGIQQRTAPGDAFDEVAIEGPKAMLINGYAGSGGDFFPWMFRHNNLGPLIGKRTWGGLVGIGAGAPLVDGGSVTAPEFSIFDLDTGHIIAENTGIDPDIDVDWTPDLAAKGIDPQLDKAIQVLMEKLAKMPKKTPRQGIPTVADPGRVGN
ncbi:S41 family peptidase [soil metagenome]